MEKEVEAAESAVEGLEGRIASLETEENRLRNLINGPNAPPEYELEPEEEAETRLREIEAKRKRLETERQRLIEEEQTRNIWGFASDLNKRAIERRDPQIKVLNGILLATGGTVLATSYTFIRATNPDPMARMLFSVSAITAAFALVTFLLFWLLQVRVEQRLINASGDIVDAEELDDHAYIYEYLTDLGKRARRARAQLPTQGVTAQVLLIVVALIFLVTGATLPPTRL